MWLIFRTYYPVKPYIKGFCTVIYLISLTKRLIRRYHTVLGQYVDITRETSSVVLPVTRKPDPPFLVPPGPNISKYLDPPDYLFQFC